MQCGYVPDTGQRRNGRIRKVRLEPFRLASLISAGRRDIVKLRDACSVQCRDGAETGSCKP